uniref:Uncharacterized protein n=1 Tax=Hyaloperonospora arabidopsidis (strain Emoy2) TaxID=559515 RepID=M4BJQ6_HYAAE
MVLDDGKTGIPGTVGIIEVGRSAGGEAKFTIYRDRNTVMDITSGWMLNGLHLMSLWGVLESASCTW